MSGEMKPLIKKVISTTVFCILIMIILMELIYIISLVNNTENCEEEYDIWDTINNPLTFQYRVYHSDSSYKSLNILFRGNGVINIINDDEQRIIGIGIDNDYFRYIDNILLEFSNVSLKSSEDLETIIYNSFDIFYWSPISGQTLSFNTLPILSQNNAIQDLFNHLESIFNDVHDNYTLINE